MQDKLYIPKKLKVGFQSRTDTYTKKLSYIIYYDEQGVLKKETSWKKWCDSKIKSVEVDNVPHEGFHLNKGVQRNGYYGGGRSMCRIYDDRGFEFEITIDNLMFILMGDDCLKRGLQGSYVYAWSGNNLVLLPTNSEEYLNSQKFTALQGKSITKEDLTPGITYRTKQQKDLTFIGKTDWLEKNYKGEIMVNNGYVFYEETMHYCYCNNANAYKPNCNFVLLQKIDSLAIAVTDTPVSNYAELVDKFQVFHGANIKEHKTESIKSINFGHSYQNILANGYCTETAPNTYQVNRIREVLEPGSDRYFYSGRKIAGYNIVPYKTVTFDGTGMKIKSCSKKDTKLYTKEELKALEFKKLSVILSSNNKPYPLAL